MHVPLQPALPRGAGKLDMLAERRREGFGCLAIPAVSEQPGLAPQPSELGRPLSDYLGKCLAVQTFAKDCRPQDIRGRLGISAPTAANVFAYIGNDEEGVVRLKSFAYRKRRSKTRWSSCKACLRGWEIKRAAGLVLTSLNSIPFTQMDLVSLKAIEQLR